MRFELDHEKAAQAAAFLLKRHSGRLNYTALIKLLYMADRQALVDSGLPITRDYMVSMENGTVLSGVLDLIKGKKAHPAWNAHIEKDGYDVVLLNDTSSFKRLSPYEMRIIEQIDSKFGHLDWRDLCALTHKFPEWHDPQGSSERIEPADILRSAARDEDEIKQIALDAEEFLFLKTA
jgi:uncharacterized phage-associated protein